MRFGKISYFVILFFAVLFALLSWFTPLREIVQMPNSIELSQNSINDYLNTQNSGLITSKFNEEESSIDFYLCNAIKIKSVEAEIVPAKTVLLGGDTMGFEYNTQGVLVLGKNKIFTKDSFISNIENNELAEGDIITSVNGQKVNNAYEIGEILNNRENNEDFVNIHAIRKGKDYETKLKPAYDLLTKKYKLGLWVKNTVNGIGTLTYIDPTTKRFGSLGHAILDGNTNVALPVLEGDLYDCTVLGVKRAVRGTAGELRGILKTNSTLGNVDSNTSAGVYGTITEDKMFKDRTEVELGGKHTVVPGKALMYTSIDGKNVRAYDIEIIKTSHQSTNNRDMVIKVTDNRLIKSTGGIVQGMSGSPIVQNGKLVGAVTHVFINDATKGFGIYIDNMINN